MKTLKPLVQHKRLNEDMLFFFDVLLVLKFIDTTMHKQSIRVRVIYTIKNSKQARPIH